MAYVTGALSRISGSMDDQGPSIWVYKSSDTNATVKAANYFSDAFNKGVRVGDEIHHHLPATGIYIHMVLTCTSAPACTVTQTPATST